MRLKDINAEITFELWLKPELTGETPNIGIGYIAPNNTGQAYRLRIDGPAVEAFSFVIPRPERI